MKTGYEGAGACKGNAQLPEMAASRCEGRVGEALSEAVHDGWLTKIDMGLLWRMS